MENTDRHFRKTELVRISSNYSRMLFTFLIGILIIKKLVSIDTSLYLVYVLVVNGIGLGAMFREILRASLVPFMSKILSNELESRKALYSKSLFFSLFLVLLYALISVIILQFTHVFDISEKYRGSFVHFYWLRFLGSALLLLCFPALSILALKGRMGVYNLWFMLERVGDFIAVQMILLSMTSLHFLAYDALIVNGTFYALWCVLMMVLFLNWFRYDNSEACFSVQRPSKEEIREILVQAKGNVYLILNMAFYFRLTLVLVNIYFGEGLSTIFGFIAQILGYLRQAVMGLITGIDSVFARISQGSKQNRSAFALQLFGEMNSLILFPAGFLLYLYFGELSEMLLSGSLLEKVSMIEKFGRIFLIGVVVRALSEHLMRYLSGVGLVGHYSSKILSVAIFTPITVSVLYLVKASSPLFWIGVVFLFSMCLSHGLIIPFIVARTGLVPLRTILNPLLLKTFIFSIPLIVYYLFNQKIYSVAMLVPLVAVQFGLFIKFWRRNVLPNAFLEKEG